MARAMVFYLIDRVIDYQRIHRLPPNERMRQLYRVDRTAICSSVASGIVLAATDLAIIPQFPPQAVKSGLAVFCGLAGLAPHGLALVERPLLGPWPVVVCASPGFSVGVFLVTNVACRIRLLSARTFYFSGSNLKATRRAE